MDEKNREENITTEPVEEEKYAEEDRHTEADRHTEEKHIEEASVKTEDFRENTMEHNNAYGNYAGTGYMYQGYGYPYPNMPYMQGYVHPGYPYPGQMQYQYTQQGRPVNPCVQPGQMHPGYQMSGYRNQNVNGMEAMYISQNMTNAEETAKEEQHLERHMAEQAASEADSPSVSLSAAENAKTDRENPDIRTRAELKAEKKARKKAAKKGKSHSGTGKKIARLIAAAVVFGLVAGAVFQGVRYGSDALFGTKQSNQNQRISDDRDNSYIEANSNAVQTVNYDVADVAAKVMPSIVSITGTYVQTYQYWFSTYEQELPGAGSGIIIGRDEKNLFVLTNYHVVEGAKELEVVFVDKESADAVVKGYDEENDIAIVLVSMEDIKDETLDQIQEITIGSSENLRVGDPCIAIGNALGYGQSVTVGYISALEREITVSDETISVLQTDAAINPGNSGGALVNMNGELIGVNTAKYVDSDVEGMGYALPISELSDIINDLIEAEGIQVSEDDQDDSQKPQAGNEIPSGQTYLGISAQTIDRNYAQMLGMPEGIYISSITDDSPAEDCGLKSGDIIVGFDGEEVKDMTILQDMVADKEAGDKVEIEFYRLSDGEYEKQTVTATLQAKE